jgi:tricarballylate dehydrogenase
MAARGLGPQRARASGRPTTSSIRGTRFNQGVLLQGPAGRHGADAIGDPTQAHMVAIDARAPLYDGGICTRIDCVSLGVVVNRDGAPLLRRGRGLLAQALRHLGPPGRAAAGPGRPTRSSTPRRSAASCRPVFAGAQARHAARAGRASWACRRGTSCRPCTHYNAACRPGTLRPHRARRLPHRRASRRRRRTGRGRSTRRPSIGYTLRPGITFTYLGLKVDETRRCALRRPAQRRTCSRPAR